MTPDEKREALANMIPLGFTDRDPYRNVYEAADAILARFNVTERNEDDWEYEVRALNRSGHWSHWGTVFPNFQESEHSWATAFEYRRRHPASEWEAIPNV